MITTSQHIAQLIYSRLNGTITEAEEMELAAWLQADGRSALFAEDINDEAILAKWVSDYTADTTIHRKQLILENIRAKLHANRSVIDLPRRVPRVHFLKTAWFRYAAAIIILFGIGAYLWNKQNNSSTITQTQPVPIKSDVLPGGQKAVLTLADGRTITLDSAANGQLAIENGSEVIKKDGQIIYGAGQLNNIDVTFNTMSTPRGGQYQLTLSDGTKVWLNAASSITYPTVFNGKTREVNITGEAYFEIAKNKSVPFVVRTQQENITVLGTSFNVNRYMDEPQGKISLVDGGVKVNEQLLQPGQAYVGGKIIKTDIEQDVAWKNGFFSFNNDDIRTVMRQLARWYDVEVEFRGIISSGGFEGKIYRNLSLSDVLELLGEARIHYKIENKKIIIVP